jgi:hypothetical protein
MRTDVIALHEDQLREVLGRIGGWDEYEHGTLSCLVCGDGVERVGLGAIRLGEAGVVAVCGRLECLEAFHE